MAEREDKKSLIDTKTSELTQEFSQIWNNKERDLTHNPILLMVGGFQGSGKSTLLDGLQQAIDLVVISGDAIRQRLIDSNFPEALRNNVVNTTTRELFQRACEMEISFAIDRHAKPENIELVQQLLIQGNFTQYQLLTIFLDTSENSLLRRVTTRKQRKGCYSGSVDDLQTDLLKNPYVDKNYYDIVIDTDRFSEEEVREYVIAEITARRNQ